MTSTIKLTIPGLPTSLHLPRTLKVEIKFKAGSTIHVDDRVIEIVTQAVTKINPDEILKVYNLGRPTEWYVTLKSQEVYTTLHMKEFTTTDHGITQVVFTHVDKPVVYGELHWVPPTFTEDMVKQIIENLAIPNTQITVKPLRKGDRWAVIINSKMPVEKLPHYLELEMGDLTHTMLLLFRGRRQNCPLCHTSRHHPGQCRREDIRIRDDIILTDDKKYLDGKATEETRIIDLDKTDEDPLKPTTSYAAAVTKTSPATQSTEDITAPLTHETSETQTALTSQTSQTTPDSAKYTRQLAAFMQGKAALTMNTKDHSARPKYTSDEKTKPGKRSQPSGDSPKHTGKKTDN